MILSQGNNTGGKLVFLETFGCQMNENDSGRILGLLSELDYSRTDVPEKADLIIINTCSIRDKAEQKVYSTLGRFRELKKERPGLIIAVSGCVAQQQGGTLLKRAPYLDMVFGTHNVHRLKDLLSEVKDKRRQVLATEFRRSLEDNEYDYTPAETGEKASVSIMRGCDNFCTYCIVPYTRGREVSRPSAEILREIRALVSLDVKEIMLLGQNVNSYGADGRAGATFPELLRKAASIEGVGRLRFITSHPKDISDELIGLFGEEPKLCRHLHLPVQSGSDRVLSRMKRGYTRVEYLSKVLRLRSLYPDMAITSDIIVGFPGETEADFNETIDLIRNVRFDNIFSFMYSKRPGTKASGFEDQVSLEARSERLLALQEMQKEITTGRNKELVGRVVEVLVEGPSKAGNSQVMGRTGCNRVVNFASSAPGAKGYFTDVLITEAYPNSLCGIVHEGSRN